METANLHVIVARFIELFTCLVCVREVEIENLPLEIKRSFSRRNFLVLGLIYIYELHLKG